MRLFNLFLRRAGVQTMPAGIVKKAGRVAFNAGLFPAQTWGKFVKTLYRDFGVAGLSVGSMQVDRAPDPALVTACVTVSCPDDLKPALMNQARQLKKLEGVRDVRWGDHRHIVLN